MITGPPPAWAASIRARLVADCHRAQADLVTDPHKWIAGRVPRGGGKTTAGMSRLLIRMTSQVRAMCVFIALTRPVAEALLWLPLKQAIEVLGLGDDFQFMEAKLWVVCKRTGSILRVVGADDKKEVNKLRGTPFHEAGIDEAGSFNAKLLEDLIDRAIGPRLIGPLWMISTPANHIDQSSLYYQATAPGSRFHRPYADRHLPEYDGWDKWSSHTWALNDPSALDKEYFRDQWARALAIKATKEWSDDNPVWRREYLAEWADDDTDNIFKFNAERNEWNPPKYGAMSFAVMPKRVHDGKEVEVTDWLYVYAMDMGHTDPFALNIFAFSPSDPKRQIFHVFGYEKREMYARPEAQLIRGEDEKQPDGCAPHEAPTGCLKYTGFPVGMIADTDQSHIDELTKVYGIRCVKADRKKDYKFGAIELVNGDLLDGRIKILKGSRLADEIRQLQWEEDDFGVKSEKKSQPNHATDTLIYARKLIAHLFDSGHVVQDRKPFQGATGLADMVPQVSPEDDFSALLDDDIDWGNE